MNVKKRKNFSRQYKARVALEAIRGVSTVNEITRESVYLRNAVSHHLD
ncbi:hypothetical protein TPL01_06930 [Sulfuriferula plumbiphila]|uniref:Transposase n=1 Tax=Sulfuriferula plumbiphila TaxID=171865 RepID=A0A512L4Z5_9PROT|nr:hypothetical protein [Sulfuriferula plumbiphila]BBP03268.1 hypothetical protein SFPGR_06900 [Sulfuriferula plumbiphila]GEP29555.1 hypothetical protein TPL01_06930 [Sulfuriferula plumbiphila]